MGTNGIVSKNLKDLRNKFGYNQEFIANYLNITAPAVSQYESDARTIPTSVIEKLALLYNVDEFDLYEEEPQKQSLVTAFAFRAGELSAIDMQTIAKFKKIINNYIHMSEALANEHA